MKNIEILYEDCNCVIVNKPAGLAVQGGEGIKSSLDRLLTEHFGKNGESSPPLLVHRLDKDTSGAILAAKGRKNAADFSRLFGADRKAVKIYIAVCASKSGNQSQLENEGIIKEELLIRGEQKKSETKYKVIKTGALAAAGLDYAVLELQLGTGRMHQIRRHLSMKNSPILGDDKYGDFSLNKKLHKEAGLKRLLLHASRIAIKEFNIDVTAPLPDYFAGYMQENFTSFV